MANQQELTLQGIVTERLFEVPDYQRPYAWDIKQLEDLWDDLDLMHSGKHYAGTLVLQRQDVEPLLTNTSTRLAAFDVVDGQQRLTTCFLLLDRLRRKFAAIQHDDAQDTAAHLRSTFGSVTIGGVKTPRLQLGAELREFWRDSILADEAIALPALVAGQERLLQARDFFDARLTKLIDGVDEAEALRRLQALNARVTSGLRFLVYEVTDSADVGVIFETLNERGKRLTDLEKIKNYFLYLVRALPDQRGAHLSGMINATWSRVFQHLATVPADQEGTLLRAHWIATKDPVERNWERTTSVKKRFERSRYIPIDQRLSGHDTARPTTDSGWDELVRDVEDYVRGLERCAHFMSELYSKTPAFVDFTSGQQRATQTQAAVRRTRVVAFFLPLFFAARLRHPQDGELYADLLQLSETFAARVFVVSQRRSDAGRSWINHIAHDLYQGASPDQQKEAMRSATWEYCNDDQFRTDLLAEANWYDRRGHKYFLYEYELSLLRGTARSTPRPFEDFVGTSSGETTEHILPQNPGDGSPWWDDFDLAAYESLRHTLGNLLLTHNNSNYGNKSYADKRGNPGQAGTTYFNAAMAQEREVAQRYEIWTPESIRDRQRSLADWAVTRWPVDRPDVGTVAELEDHLPEDPDEAEEMDSDMEGLP